MKAKLTMKRHNGLPAAAQRGFTLVVVLIVLIVVSLMGVSASQMVLLSEKSTRYDRDWQLAFQSAEAALLDAEFDIRGPNTSAASRVSTFTTGSLLGFVDGCASGTTDRGLCLPALAPNKDVWYTVDFTNTSAGANTVALGEFTGRTLDHGVAGPRPVQAPRYIVEVIPDTLPGRAAGGTNFLYRVTAMGFGPRVETQAVVQMIFRKE